MQFPAPLHVQLAIAGAASLLFALFLKAATKIWVNQYLVFSDAYALSFLVLGICILIRYVNIRILGFGEGIILATSWVPIVSYFVFSSLIFGKLIKHPENGSIGVANGFAVSERVNQNETPRSIN